MATSEIFMLLALVSTGIFLLQFVISIFFGGLDIDRAGRIYINQGDGRYTVFVNRDGAERELDVVSESGRTDYKTDEVVTVKEYRDNKYFIG